MEKEKKLFSRAQKIIATLFVLLILSIGVGAYFYIKATEDPQKVAQKELKQTINAVGKLMVLPTDETPTIATVSDPSKLKDQPFFANSEKGDRVLVYSNSRKAILYRPGINKIIEVAPVNLGATTPNNN